MGSSTGQASARSLPRSSSTTRAKLAPMRSILFTNAIRGTLYRSAWRHTVSLCGWTPPTAQNTHTAPSRTRSDRSTSIVKSTWPGVSIMLIEWPFHSQEIAADCMVMPRSRSCTMKSVVVLPSCTSPCLCIFPV